MKQLDRIWGQVVARKLGVIIREREILQRELAERVGVEQAYISRVFAFQQKGSEEFFREVCRVLKLSEKETDSIMLISLLEVVEREYPQARDLFSKYYSLGEK